jgi:hypothetical protein
MKRMLHWLVASLSLTLMLAVVIPASAQSKTSTLTSGGGVDVTCTNGAHITNGVEIVVNMRPGYTYTATAIGINGFDPVLAVLNASGSGLCADDDATAAGYSANLPTTGAVPASHLSARVSFNQTSSSGFEDVHLVVGGYDGAEGEFLLVLEGMAVTREDGTGALAGDPFFVRITPNMVASGVPLTAYMISLDNRLDPMIRLVGDNHRDILVCDDAGTANCAGQSWNLSTSYISHSRGRLGGYQYDAMLSIDLTGLQLNPNPTDNYYEFRMTSYNQSTFGHYLVAFHIGTRPQGGISPAGSGL